MPTLLHPAPVPAVASPLRGLRARLHALFDDPVALLHRYYWSAPWLEAKLDRKQLD